MVKQLLILFLLVPITAWGGAPKKQLTILNCQVYGYPGEMIYFSSSSDISLRAEFHTNPGEDHTYRFETDRLVPIFVNGKELFLEPGDSLCAIIRYEENLRVPSISFSGTERAVIQNNIFRQAEDLRRTMGYKEQLLACVAVDIKPAQRIKDSEAYLAKVSDLLEAAKAHTSEAFRNYVMANTEAKVYLSLIEYPSMYASVRKVPVEEQGIGDYWKLTDGITLREDAASLSCYAYCGFLLQYCVYSRKKEAHEKGVEYVRLVALESVYEDLATFYKGPLRDVSLYTVLANHISQGGEIANAQTLIKDYTKKYNKNKAHLAQLNLMLQ